MEQLGYLLLLKIETSLHQTPKNGHLLMVDIAPGRYQEIIWHQLTLTLGRLLTIDFI